MGLQIALGVILAWVLVTINVQGDRIMATIAELKAAVDTAVGQVKADIAAAISKEKGEIVTQIQALKDQIAAGASVSAEDLNSILASVGSIGTTGVAAVDTISQEDGAQG